MDVRFAALFAVKASRVARQDTRPRRRTRCHRARARGHRARRRRDDRDGGRAAARCRSSTREALVAAVPSSRTAAGCGRARSARARASSSRPPTRSTSRAPPPPRREPGAASWSRTAPTRSRRPRCWCDLLYGGDAPIVFTGAMRPASALGADGPANLLDAVRVAGAAETAGLGVLVCFAGEVHAARAVRKTDSVSPRAFASPRQRPGRPRGRRARVDGHAARPCGGRRSRSAARRAGRLVPAALGADGTLVDARWSRRAPTASSRSCSAPATRRRRSSPRCRAAAERIPVVVTVRPERGRSCAAPTPSTAPSATCAPAGLICAPACSPAAARIKLMACLGAGHSRVAMAGVFATDRPRNRAAPFTERSRSARFAARTCAVR